MNDLVPVSPISPLRQRLIEDMTMRRFSPETQRNYLRDVGRFATWLGRSPHTATAEDIRRFQIEQQEAGVPAPTMNSIVAALRFFFTHTLDRPGLVRSGDQESSHDQVPPHCFDLASLAHHHRHHRKTRTRHQALGQALARCAGFPTLALLRNTLSRHEHLLAVGGG